MTINIEKSKNELNKLIIQFDSLEINDKKIKDVKANVAVVNQILYKILAEYQVNLIGNKDYTFEFEESRIEDIFGRVIDLQVSIIIMIFFNLNDFHLFHLNLSDGTQLFLIKKIY